MKRRRLLYLATFDPTVSATGTSTRGRLFLDHLARRYEVHLVHMREPDAEGRDEALLSRLASRVAVDFSSLEYFLWSPKLERAAAGVLARSPVDCIFADFEKAGWYAARLGRRFGVPYVYNSHNVEYLRYLDFARRNPLRYPLVPYMWWLERQAVKSALFTVAISEPDRRRFLAFAPGERVWTLPCTFDEEVFHPRYDEIRTPDPVILMVGNYRNPGNREGAYRLCETVVPEVVARFPKATFRCVGKNFPDDLRHPNVESVGFVDDLVAEYRRAALVVVPIAIGGGIKIKAVEGLACGKFVVATPKGVEGIDAAGMANLKVLPLERFAECILGVLSTPVPRTDANFERLAQGYGTHRPLARLCDRIDAACG